MNGNWLEMKLINDFTLALPAISKHSVIKKQFHVD